LAGIAGMITALGIDAAALGGSAELDGTVRVWDFPGAPPP